MIDIIEKAARAVEERRIRARVENNEVLSQMGLWPDHSYQPPNSEIVRAVIRSLRDNTDSPRVCDELTLMLGEERGEEPK